MKKYITFILLFLFNGTTSRSQGYNESNYADRVRKWLIYSIEHRYNYKGNRPEDTTIKMYTKQYEEFKRDAIGRDFDGLTEKQFTDKWRGKYNLKFVTSNSILIGQQDWTKIVVRKCILKKRLPNRALMFSVLIEDDHDYPDVKGHLKHNRDIEVIPYGNTFIIDNVLEYD
ncbi:MAG: hypothetical protein ACTHNW_13140 [Mucilaginibacter sp.]